MPPALQHSKTDLLSTGQLAGEPSRYLHYCRQPTSAHILLVACLRSRLYELAVLTLEEDVGYQQGWLGLRYTCETRPVAVESAGYPRDLNERAYGAAQGDRSTLHMYRSTGTLDAFSGCSGAVRDGCVTGDLDSNPGQSGSAVWDSDWMVRAVHVASDYGGHSRQRTVNAWAMARVLEVLGASN